MQGVFYSSLATVADLQSYPFQVHKGPKGQSDFFFCGNFVIFFATALPLCYFRPPTDSLTNPPAPSLVAGGFEMRRANKNQAYVSLSSEDEWRSGGVDLGQMVLLVSGYWAPL